MNVSQTTELKILSDPANLASVREAVRHAAADARFANPDAEQVVLAVDEALTNVIKHSYGGRRDRPIEVRLDVVSEPDRGGLRIVVRDHGTSVDPTAIRGRDLDEVRPGGLGVHIIQTVMDDVSYEPAEGGGTRLTMTKWNRS